MQHCAVGQQADWLPLQKVGIIIMEMIHQVPSDNPICKS